MVTAAVALGITAGTLAIFTVLGILYTRGKVAGVEDFISARSSAGVGTTTATLIASGMGAWILFSPAEAGAAFGGIAAVLGYAIGSALPLIVFIWLGPRIRELIPRGHTLTEYARARYGPGMHAYVLLVSILYMFIFLAAEMTGIAGALALVAGVPAWQTAALVGGFVLIYTAYGGLLASLFTDTVQTLVILPLVAIGFAGALLALGGPGQVHATVLEGTPSALDPGFAAGLEFGAFVVIAILGAEMLNQSWWQRIYAAKDTATLRKGFAFAAAAVVPMILLAGLFGLAATGLGNLVTDPTAPGYNADVSLFLLLEAALPTWVTLAVVLLAVLLVMSTADTLFNAISSLVTTDLPTLVDVEHDRTLVRIARATTAVAALGAIAIGARGYSVLQVFLTADLLAAATFVPLLHGLVSRRAHPVGVLVASLVGLIGGVVFFPTLRGLVAQLPVLGASLPAPSFLYAFVTAAGLSTLVTLVWARLGGHRFEMGMLDERIGRLDATEPPTRVDEAPEPAGGEV